MEGVSLAPHAVNHIYMYAIDTLIRSIGEKYAVQGLKVWQRTTGVFTKKRARSSLGGEEYLLLDRARYRVFVQPPGSKAKILANITIDVNYGNRKSPATVKGPNDPELNDQLLAFIQEYAKISLVVEEPFGLLSPRWLRTVDGLALRVAVSLADWRLCTFG